MLKIAKWVLLGGLAFLLAVPSFAEARRRSRPAAGRRAKAKKHRRAKAPPVALRLIANRVHRGEPGSVGIGVAVLIKNTTDTVQPYFRDDNTWHQCELEIRTARGQKVRRTDLRSILTAPKEATAHKRADLDYLKPRQEKYLARSELTKDTAGRCKLSWGPYIFRRLNPGTYRARVRQDMRTNRYYDPKARTWGKAKKMWRGRVQSPWVELVIPSCR